MVAAAAAAGGWHARLRAYQPSTDQKAANHSASIWVAMSRSEETMERLTASSGEPWRLLEARPGFAAWTDDHASLLPLIRWPF